MTLPSLQFALLSLNEVLRQLKHNVRKSQVVFGIVQLSAKKVVGIQAYPLEYLHLSNHYSFPIQKTHTHTLAFFISLSLSSAGSLSLYIFCPSPLFHFFSLSFSFSLSLYLTLPFFLSLHPLSLILPFFHSLSPSHSLSFVNHKKSFHPNEIACMFYTQFVHLIRFVKLDYLLQS